MDRQAVLKYLEAHPPIKGGSYKTRTLEDLTGVRASDRRFSLAVQALKEIVEQVYLNLNDGVAATLRVSNDTLEVLTDAEASKHEDLDPEAYFAALVAGEDPE